MMREIHIYPTLHEGVVKVYDTNRKQIDFILEERLNEKYSDDKILNHDRKLGPWDTSFELLQKNESKFIKHWRKEKKHDWFA